MKLVAALAALSVIATTTASTTAAALAQEAAEPTRSHVTRATVSADVVDADAVLAVVSRGDFAKPWAAGLGRSLEVIAADGTRHPVHSVDLRWSRQGALHRDFLLADWRPETHTALLRVTGRSFTSRAVSYDVTTGERHTVPLAEEVASVGLLPDGSGVVVADYPTSPWRGGRVATLTWDGVRTELPARTDMPQLTSVDGGTLVAAETEKRRWWVVDLATRTSVKVPTGRRCAPLRWYDAGSVVASCMDRRGAQLMRVGLDGSQQALGVRHGSGRRKFRDPVWDDTDVRTVQGRDWYESTGSCGGSFLTRQTASGKVRLVAVTAAERGDENISLVGARGDDLVLARTESCEGARGPGVHRRGVLWLFDPVAGDRTVLARIGRRESWHDLRSAGEVSRWGW